MIYHVMLTESDGDQGSGIASSVLVGSDRRTNVEKGGLEEAMKQLPNCLRTSLITLTHPYITLSGTRLQPVTLCVSRYWR